VRQGTGYENLRDTAPGSLLVAIGPAGAGKCTFATDVGADAKNKNT
jgi:ABC-type hemin transport system ATPase subunit